MAILEVENINKFFGELQLFKNLSFVINSGEKVGLIANNGTGKTTILSLILGKDTPESGLVFIEPSATVGFLPQEPYLDNLNSIYEEVFHSNAEIIEIISSYKAATLKSNSVDLQKWSDKMDAFDAWNYENQVKYILSKMNFTDILAPINTLSGGQKKRVALAKLLLLKPDFLILDEPTNHLDIEIIEWLENFLINMNSTLLMVTHDRYFLDRVCTNIVEIDNKQAYKYEGNYETFLFKKQEREELHSADVNKAKNLMRKELDWMMRQPQARGTKAKYRINAFYDLQDKASQSVNSNSLQITVKTSRLGNKVLDLSNISKAYGKTVLVNKFSHSFTKNDKIAIVGNNGCGKSTLLDIVNNIKDPDSGNIEYGETLVLGYYRQDGLVDYDNKKVIEVITEIADLIEISNGHFLSATQFLEQWLFPRSMHYMYVSKLSGGEKKRLYLMTVLMRKPNFLILDEPTNDLDLSTLRILEEYLLQFEGCVLIVSHDRFFTDKVVQHLFVYKGAGEIQKFPGNYSQYRLSIAKNEINEVVVKEKPVVAEVKKTKKGMSYKEKVEFEKLDSLIAELESRKSRLEDDLNSSSDNHEKILEISTELGVVIENLDEAELRWLELSEID